MAVYPATGIRPPLSILVTIVVAQFLSTSVWFAGNAMLPALSAQFHLSPTYLSYLASSVQLGFIMGTLLFSLLAVADRFLPSRVFFFSALAAAVANAALIIPTDNIYLPLLCRFATGLFLAGIYPVGMKIAADHYSAGLGKTLGLLVGALVLGTALPHLLNGFPVTVSWRKAVLLLSLLCAVGGMGMLWLVPTGPFRKPGQRLRVSALRTALKSAELRSAALGYFGHMWELYTFWTFVPLLFATHYQTVTGHSTYNPMAAFFVIAAGSVACAWAGWLSGKKSAASIATIALLVSGCCCFLSPFFISSTTPVFIGCMVCWGAAVIADSPLFSTIIAREAPAETRGSVITLITCIGFAITICSIQLTSYLAAVLDHRYLFVLVGIGPLAGVAACIKKRVH